MAPAAALAAQAEQRPSTGDPTKRKKLVQESQFTQVLQTLRAVGGMIEGPRGAVARLGLKRATLVSKMKRLRIYRPRHQRSMSEFNEGSSARPKHSLCF
jgi:transcriptional regulator with GAF, ATPase, and Fis domain